MAFKNIVDLFTQIKNEVNLPEYVNQFIENENKGVPENEQVKQKPNEILYNDFYLFSLEDVILISEIEGTITNSNEDQLTSNDIDIKDNKEDNEEVNKYNTCISILNNHISDFKQIYENDIKHKKKIFYFINEETKLNNIEKNDSEYDAQFIEDIEFLIIEFFDKYPNGTNMQLYQMLHEKYSDVFDKEPNDMYSGNITKMICSSSGWKRAYEYSMEKSVLRSKYYAHCVVTDNSEEAKVRLQASDKIVNWDLSEKKLALEKRKLDLLEKSSSGGNSDSISNETNNTLNLIVEGLKELGDDNE